MNNSGRKMYRGSVLLRAKEKTWQQVMGFCVLVPLLVAMVVVFLVM
jgi:hypothetical protein